MNESQPVRLSELRRYANLLVRLTSVTVAAVLVTCAASFLGATAYADSGSKISGTSKQPVSVRGQWKSVLVSKVYLVDGYSDLPSLWNDKATAKQVWARVYVRARYVGTRRSSVVGSSLATRISIVGHKKKIYRALRLSIDGFLDDIQANLDPLMVETGILKGDSVRGWVYFLADLGDKSLQPVFKGDSGFTKLKSNRSSNAPHLKAISTTTTTSTTSVIAEDAAPDRDFVFERLRKDVPLFVKVRDETISNLLTSTCDGLKKIGDVEQVGRIVSEALLAESLVVTKEDVGAILGAAVLTQCPDWKR